MLWSIDGGTVTFTWTASSGANGYRLEAGTGPNLSDIATVVIPATSSYAVPNVPPGRYYVRLRASGPAGLSAASNEVIVDAGAGGGNCFEPPGTPTGLRAVVDRTLVNVAWTPAGCAATSYLVRAGSSDGAADLAQISVPSAALSANAPDGVYFISVVAVNQYGASAPTGSIIVLVAAPTAGGSVGFNTATPAIGVDSVGNAVIIGEVVNRSVESATFIRVAAQLRDAGGGVIGTAATFLRGQPRRLNATGVIDDSALGPGEIGCFYIQTGVSASAVAHTSLQLQFDRFASSAPVSRVDVVDFTRLPNPGFAALSVTMLNRGPAPTLFNVATIYLKRADGRAIGCDFAFADDALAPGQAATIVATTHAPANASSMTAWMHWEEAADPLASLAAQTFRSMRDLVNAGQKREAHAAWEALQAQRRAAAAQGGQ